MSADSPALTASDSGEDEVSISTLPQAEHRGAVSPKGIGITDGLVLGGGGAKGSFETGVLGYLYRLQGLQPQVIAGTSVGAINAMKLAEGTLTADLFGPFGSAVGGHQGLAGLENLWLGLKEKSDMYVGSPGFDELPYDVQQDISAGLSSLLSGIVGEYFGLIGVTAAFGPFGLIPDIDLASKLASLGTAAADFLNGRSLYTLTPVENLYSTAIDVGKVQSSNVDLVFALVGLDSGELCYARYNRSASSGQSGAVGDLVSRDDMSVILVAQIDMKDAMLGSAADPIFLAPRDFAGDLFVDGGVREVVPVNAAVQLGANRIFAVLCDPPFAPEKRDAHDKFIGLAERCLAIAVDEIELGDIDAHVPDQSLLWKIRPAFPVHDPFTIEPALIRIDLDHGYMRGFDTVDGRVRSSHRRDLMTDRSLRIAQLRVQTQKLEADLITAYNATTDDAAQEQLASEQLPAIQVAKAQIRELLESRLRLGGQYASRPSKSMAWPAMGSVTPVTPDDVWDQWEEPYGLMTKRPAIWPNGFQPQTPLLGSDDLADEKRWWVERQGTCGWCFQSTNGQIGDFELVVPQLDAHGNVALAHHSRLNDEKMAWKRNADVIAAPTSAVSPVPLSACVFQGNYGWPQNFEGVVRMRPAAATHGDIVVGIWRDGTSGAWHTYDITIGGDPISATGDPAILQSAIGQQGNFEMLVPQTAADGAGILAHYTRNNDAGGSWSRNSDAIPAPATSGQALELETTPIAVSAFQGNYGAPANLEAVVWMHPVTGDDYLVGLRRDSATTAWSTYDIRIGTAPIVPVGAPYMFQSTAGRQGNFELLVPQRDDQGGTFLAHYTRMNDYHPPVWSGPLAAYPPPAPPAPAPTPPDISHLREPQPIHLGGGSPQARTDITHPTPPIANFTVVGTPTAATAFQSNYGTPPSFEPTGGLSADVSAHPNFEGVVRVRADDGSESVVGIWFDPAASLWHSYGITESGRDIGVFVPT